MNMHLHNLNGTPIRPWSEPSEPWDNEIDRRELEPIDYDDLMDTIDLDLFEEAEQARIDLSAGFD